jgi:uncharacterized protein YcbX
MRHGQARGERIASGELDPRRFQGNICVDGVPAWEELSWDTFTPDGAKSKVVEPTVRCDVTSYNVNPGAWDMNILKVLSRQANAA